MNRPWNFSAGPAILPGPVLERVAEATRALGGSGHAQGYPEAKLSIMEISHRSRAFDEIHNRALELVHEVIGVPRSHQVLVLQGGASLQFCMVPMNLGQRGKTAGYVDTGVWSAKAIKESKMLGTTEIVASSKDSNYDHIPALPAPSTYQNASYLHITSNNTVYGTEFSELPDTGEVPLVVDLSSDVASRQMDLERVTLGFAGAQKNLGPSGVTLVFLHKDVLEWEVEGVVPSMLRYTTHAQKNSLYNTPNTFGILVLECVLDWVKEQGGVDAVAATNERKAGKLYARLDESALFSPHARRDSRSWMNVTWTLTGRDDSEIQARTTRFLAEATAVGFNGLKGHRSVGGCRASIYNAFPEAGVDALVAFMEEFERKG